jgi:hypothetical protein
MTYQNRILLLCATLAILVLPGCATRQTTNPSVDADLIVAADGSAEYETITDAIDDASDGDVILVKPGTYEEEVELDESTDNLTLIGTNPATTIIDADGEYAALTLSGGSHRVSNFTLRGGESHGVYASDGHHQVDHCLITGNGDRGVYVSTMSGNPTVELDHLTIVDNKVSGIYTVKDDAETSIRNCIVAFNNRGIVCDQDEGEMTIQYNCVFNESDNYDRVTPGKGCIKKDPEFKNRDGGNYRLKTDSPCIGKASDGSNIGCF